MSNTVPKKADGVIFDIKRYAIHDGPGIRTTIFFKGCPLRCAWCHNPESWSREPELMVHANRCIRCGRCTQICPQQAVNLSETQPVTNLDRCVQCGTCVTYCPPQARRIAGRQVTVENIMTEVVKDVVFYDQSGGGVSLSGGEPLMQPEFLCELLRQCRERKIHTAVDTCGYAAAETVRNMAPQADLFLCDIKHMDTQKHKELTGVDNTLILENVAFLAESGHAVIIRVPVVPGFNDTLEEILSIANFVKSLKNIQQIDLLPYNTGGVHKAERLGHRRRIVNRTRQEPAALDKLAQTVRHMGFKVTIGG